MPILEIRTNIPAAKIPNGFLKDTTTLLAQMLGKPESYVLVCIEPGLLMSWAGTQGPTAVVHLYNIGEHTPKVTQERTEILTKHLVKELVLEKDRMYIVFHEAKRFEISHNGRTFHG